VRQPRTQGRAGAPGKKNNRAGVRQPLGFWVIFRFLANQQTLGAGIFIFWDFFENSAPCGGRVGDVIGG